jgi:glycosyltransferase involved in cell wall biosynthesis
VRIAYAITRADAVGGASVHVLELASAMRERGHEVLVLVGGEGPVTELLAAAGVPVRRLRHLRRSVNPLHDARAFRELGEALRAFRPDLLSTHTAKAGWLGRAAARRLGIPVLYTPHGWPLGNREPGPRGAVFRLAERTAAPWTTSIVCVCEYERHLALTHGIGRPDQLVVIHNGVRNIPANLRADPGKTPVRLVSVARFEPPKDPELLLRALAPLARLSWTLDFIGDGPLETACRKLAQTLGLEARVNFLGYRTDVAQVLASAQIFVLASRSEAFPRSVLEAMRAGLPVVASDVGGISEAVDNETSGFLAGSGDERGLSASIRGLIENTAGRQRLGSAARLTFEAKFRLECMIDRTAGLYDTVVSHDARK